MQKSSSQFHINFMNQNNLEDEDHSKEEALFSDVLKGQTKTIETIRNIYYFNFYLISILKRTILREYLLG